MGKPTSSNSDHRDKLYNKLDKLYYDTNFPGAFSGISTFHRHAKKKIPSLTLKDVQSWKEQNLHVAKRSRINKPKIRRSVQVFNPDGIWEGDLVDMGSANIRLNRNVR